MGFSAMHRLRHRFAALASAYIDDHEGQHKNPAHLSAEKSLDWLHNALIFPNCDL
jgi:hypothetical protein